MTNHTLSITLYHQSEETRHETREACVLIGTLSKGGRGVSLISLTYGGPRPTPPPPMPAAPYLPPPKDALKAEKGPAPKDPGARGLPPLQQYPPDEPTAAAGSAPSATAGDSAADSAADSAGRRLQPSASLGSASTSARASTSAWVGAWRQSLGCWWGSLPMPTQQQLGGCLGALSLHLGSR